MKRFSFLYRIFLGVIIYCFIMFIFYFCFTLKKPKKIAFLSASGMLYHEEVRSNFLKCAITDLGIHVDYFSTFNTSDKLAIAAVCETLLSAENDCIVVVGRSMAQIVVNLANKKGIKTPVVFIGVDKPIELGLVSTLECPGYNATGVFTSGLDDELYGRLFYLVLPKIKSILIPYYARNDIDRAIEQRTRSVASFLKKKKVKVCIAPLDSPHNVLEIVEGLLPNYQMIATFEGDTFDSQYMTGFGKLADQYQIPFFSSVKGGTSEGALFTYGVNPYYASQTAFNLVKKIVYDHVPPCVLSVVSLDSSRDLVINMKRALKLGINIDIDRIKKEIESDNALAVMRDHVIVIK